MIKVNAVANTTSTLFDVQLSKAYYPILVEAAQKKELLSYGELVKKAQMRYPDVQCVKTAIAISTGRRLDVVRQFTNENGLPDVTSLVVNKAKGECGKGFTDSYNPEVIRRQVFDFDWSDVVTDFDSFIQEAVRIATPRKKRTVTTARHLMWDYYKDNKSTLPPAIIGRRDEIIAMLVDGFSVEETYEKMETEEVGATPLLAA